MLQIEIVPWEYRALGEPSCLYLEVHYPDTLEDASMEFEVNGEKAYAKGGGGGSSGRRRFTYVELFAGEPGKKEIRVVFRKKDVVAEGKKTLEFRSKGSVLLLDRPDESAILDKGPLRFWSFFATEVRAKVNGAAVAPKSEPSKLSKHHVLLTLTPDWRAGWNTVEIAAKGPVGEISGKWSLFLAEGGKLKVGDTFLIQYGIPGSRSGPFYSFTIEGKAVEGGAVDGETRTFELRDGIHLSAGAPLLARLKAQATGEATLKIYVKRNFRDKEAVLERELKFTVSD